MTAKTTTARVNAANAYRQIITNFSDPLEFVREAISNSIDAGAQNLSIAVEQIKGPTGQPEILIVIKDDGRGMDERCLERFFNLGDSAAGELKDTASGEAEIRVIGEKGFGTKIYLNSRKVEVRTTDRDSDVSSQAISQGHLERIHNGMPPEYVATQQPQGFNGTEIKIFGYNHNDSTKLGHDQIRDYILWFTKLGSTEPLCGTPSQNMAALVIDWKL